MRQLVGAAVHTVDPRGVKGLIKNTDEASFVAKYVMTNLREVERRGKWILMIFESPNPAEPFQALVSHLGMHGYWRVDHNSWSDEHPHQRMRFNMYSRQGPATLRYMDMRSWGKLYAFTHAEALAFLKGRVGVDAMAIDEGHMLAVVWDTRPIAEILLDQTRIAGIGNIYRSEILWRAKIAPDRPGTDLTYDEVMMLQKATRHVMARAVELRGSSIRDFRDSNGDSGEYQRHMEAYGRAGCQCFLCQDLGVIRATKEIDGRTVYYCPVCQK